MTSEVSGQEERAVINSALWAAAGDAIGWITELADSARVQARIGAPRVVEPVPWSKLIGGRMGPRARFPAGAYSDDTQLRLSVCRSIRGNGVFDPEAFAKVELPVWLSYALGAGRGTRAAASNLAKRDVNWFSNFYKSKEQLYVASGGNGAAMRVQPIVWAATRDNRQRWMTDVLRSAVVTHGHMHGIGGAYFHALTLSTVLDSGVVPGPEEWAIFATGLEYIPDLMMEDRHLATFWMSAWEGEQKSDLGISAHNISVEALKDIDKLSLDGGTREDVYRNVLERLGCFDPKFRGSGLKTAIAASVLAWIYRECPVEEALSTAANALGSDTDTIATMAGAILGAVSATPPHWKIQDREYIIAEAARLAGIRAGRREDSFGYPDIAKWNPPATQADALGILEDGRLAIAGLSAVEGTGESYAIGDSEWQWLTLSIGQRILAKRRTKVRKLPPHTAPVGRVGHTQRAELSVKPDTPLQRSLPLDEGADLVVRSSRRASDRQESSAERRAPAVRKSIDELTDAVIKGGFDPLVLGRVLLELMDDARSTDAAIAFVAIVAKARIARLNRAG